MSRGGKVGRTFGLKIEKGHKFDLFFLGHEFGNWCAVFTVTAIVNVTANVIFILVLSQIGRRKVGWRLPRILRVKERE